MNNKNDVVCSAKSHDFFYRFENHGRGISFQIRFCGLSFKTAILWPYFHNNPTQVGVPLGAKLCSFHNHFKVDLFKLTLTQSKTTEDDNK